MKKPWKQVLTVKVEMSEDKKSILISTHNQEYTFKIENPKEISIISKSMEGNAICYFKSEYVESRRRFRLIEKIMDQCW
jgi:hypothetical protein